MSYELDDKLLPVAERVYAIVRGRAAAGQIPDLLALSWGAIGDDLRELCLAMVEGGYRTAKLEAMVGGTGIEPGSEEESA